MAISRPTRCNSRGPMKESMISDRACAVVVSYHPGPDVLENLALLGQQLRAVIVVDNGSTPEELAHLRSARSSIGFVLIENGENLGIATALNYGIRHALSLLCDRVFLFDQDSRITPGFVETMLSAFDLEASRGRLGILIPQYVDKRLGTAMPTVFESDGTIESAMTSGSLIASDTLRDHGLFVDELFIDGVDHEFSLRLRAAGFVIALCSEALLLHSPGAPTRHTLPWRRKPFLSSNYGHVRRYYQERNRIWLFRRYWRTFPGFCRRQTRDSLKEFSKIVMFERDKLRKIRHLLRGLWHGLRGRMGRLEG